MSSERNRGRRRRHRPRPNDGQLPGGYNGPEPIVLTHHSFTSNNQDRRRRGGGGGNNSNRDQRHRSHGNNNRGQQQQPQHHSPRPPVSSQPGELDAFELFSAYHLGLTADGRYQQQNINDIARRFNKTPAEIKQLLMDFRIDAESMLNSGFDVSLAQLDIMVAPEGINKRELAKNLFQEFMAAPRKPRDWGKELAEDAEINKKTFGK